jgi:voltage-gated potassium channel
VIGIIGIGMVALPAGLLASGFSAQLHQRQREFEQAVGRILASGRISPAEGDQLRAFRDQLGLSDHQAAEIVRFLVHERRAGHCPHCGQSLEPTTTVRHDAAGHEPHPRASEREPATRRRAAVPEP